MRDWNVFAPMPSPVFKKDAERQTALVGFVNWVDAHIKGDERAEAQVFLNAFFKCFGYEGVIEAGGKFEVPVANASLLENTGFVDCVFEDIAIFEMKGFKEDLQKYYRQLKDYWVQITPKPRFAILCNFREFWIYDFNAQMGEPVQKLVTAQLAEHYHTLVFMEKESKAKKIDFQHNVEEITKKTVDGLKAFYDDLMQSNQYGGSKLPEEDIQHFVLQCMLCMFAEDIGLMPHKFFTDLVKDCLAMPERTYDMFSDLFTRMNTPDAPPLGQFKEIAYFNGGLFAKQIPIELTEGQLRMLHDMARQDWRPIEPAIFGTIFERMIDKGVRHADGVHYTSEIDIEHIIRPTITQYWQARIQEANATNTADAFAALLDAIRVYRVLDPACGSGNFLYKALIELKELEHVLIQQYTLLAETPDAKYTQGEVGSHQFFGLDKNHFAVELAKLTLEIGRKKAVDKLGLKENVLPLNNLEHNLICADALFTDWPDADAIIGNPPFIGGYKIRKELGDENTEALYAKFSEVKGQADYCTFWFRKAQDHPAKRCGLVASNSIAQGTSRRASLDYIIDNGGIIHNAISTQKWSGEANVHVSLVNWCKTPFTGDFILDNTTVKSITSSLTDSFDVTQANRLKANKSKSFEGCKLTGQGFSISKEQADLWTAENPLNADVLRPIVEGKTSINRNLELDWIIDFNDLSIEKASSYRQPYEHVQKYVKPFRASVRRQSTREKWWQFGEKRPSMRLAIEPLTGYFTVSQVSKYTIFQYFEKSILPCGANVVVTSDDFYVLGVLNSRLHMDWVKVQGSTLKADPRYTNTTCFDTFPFSWEAPEKTKETIRAIANRLDDYRMATMLAENIGITALYNRFFNEPASQLFKLHAELDKAICEQVYGWPYDPAKNYNAQLFELNQTLAAAE